MKKLFVGCVQCTCPFFCLRYCHYYLKVERPREKETVSSYLLSWHSIFFVSYIFHSVFFLFYYISGSARNSVAQNGFYLIFYALWILIKRCCLACALTWSSSHFVSFSSWAAFFSFFNFIYNLFCACSCHDFSLNSFNIFFPLLLCFWFEQTRKW